MSQSIPQPSSQASISRNMTSKSTARVQSANFRNISNNISDGGSDISPVRVSSSSRLGKSVSVTLSNDSTSSVDPATKKPLYQYISPGQQFSTPSNSQKSGGVANVLRTVVQSPTTAHLGSSTAQSPTIAYLGSSVPRSRPSSESCMSSHGSTVQNPNNAPTADSALADFKAPMVFLGGSCNPTTWRRDIAIPRLSDVGITYFNPQIDSWTPEFLVLENIAKEGSEVLLFIIDGLTRGIASQLEVTELITRGRKLVLCVEDIVDGLEIQGEVITGRQLQDLNRGRAFLRDLAVRNDACCVVRKSVEDAIQYIIDSYQENDAGFHTILERERDTHNFSVNEAQESVLKNSQTVLRTQLDGIVKNSNGKS